MSAAGPAPDQAAQQAALLKVVEVEAEHLCLAVKAADRAGVPDALMFPALVSVFREAGMLPESLDLGGLLGMLR